VQLYGNVPAVVNLKEKLLPDGRLPLLNTPVVLVTVWVILSVFVHVTVVPAVTVMEFGVNFI